MEHPVTPTDPSPAPKRHCDSLAEDRVKAWWVGAGAAELKVYLSFCNAGVSTAADGKSREGRTTEPFSPFS